MIRTHPTRRRDIAFCCVLATAALAADPVSLRVCSVHLGPSGTGVPAAALTAGLRPGPWTTVESADRGGDGAAAWNVAPAPRAGTRDIVAVTAGFGDRADAYAFAFEPMTGAMVLLRHQPFRMTLIRGSKQWFAPTTPLAAGIRLNWSRALAEQRPAVRLVVTAWGADAAAAGAAVSANLEQDGTDTLSSSGAKSGLAPLTAMVYGAAGVAGWTPTTGDAPVAVDVEIRFTFKAASFIFTLKADGRTDVLVRENVDQEQYHDLLAGVFRYFRHRDQLLDVHRLHAGAVELLAASSQRICFRAGGVRGFDPGTGAVVWSSAACPPKDACAVRLGKGGAGVVYRTSGALAEVDPATGKEQQLAAVGVTWPWGFARLGAAAAAVVRGRAVAVWRDGKRVWRHEAATPVNAGPVLSGGRLFVGEAAGAVTALNTANGRVAWTRQVEAGLHGAMAQAGGVVVVFSASSETLHALSGADGAPVWRYVVGDRLVTAPQDTPAGLLVAAKNNHIVLLDPADGAPRATAAWPRWLLSVLPLPREPRPLVACTDIRGQLTFLDGRSLKPLQTVGMGVRFAPGMAFVPRFRVVRTETFAADGGLEMEPVEITTAPTLLASDVTGDCYLFRLPP